MDAINRMSELIENNPDITNDELAKILVEEGYAKNEEMLHKFFNLVGLV